MEISIKQIYGDTLDASDGEIGHVKDARFDAEQWAIRYLVADTGSWLPERLVLISPYALGPLSRSGTTLPLNLTRKQIENSPLIASQNPVSRQSEEDYCRYYGWPRYWQGDPLWDRNGRTSMARQSNSFSRGFARQAGAFPARAEEHLRSAQSVIGYEVHTGKGAVGRVTDLVVDDKTWEISHLVVNMARRWWGKTALLEASQIDWIEWNESRVFVMFGFTRQARFDL